MIKCFYKCFYLAVFRYSPNLHLNAFYLRLKFKGIIIPFRHLNAIQLNSVRIRAICGLELLLSVLVSEFVRGSFIYFLFVPSLYICLFRHHAFKGVGGETTFVFVRQRQILFVFVFVFVLGWFALILLCICFVFACVLVVFRCSTFFYLLLCWLCCGSSSSILQYFIIRKFRHHTP